MKILNGRLGVLQLSIYIKGNDTAEAFKVVYMKILNSSHFTQQSEIDTLKRGSLFGALSNKSINLLLEKGEILQLKHGDTLYNDGDSGGCFYIILKGRILFFRLKQGEYTFVRGFVFGEELGFIAMIALHNRIGKATAEEDSVVLKITSDVFYDLHETLPTDFGILLLNLSRDMARRIREYTS